MISAVRSGTIRWRFPPGLAGEVSLRDRVPMAELRPLCLDLGWDDGQTYVQSGNLVFHAAGLIRPQIPAFRAPDRNDHFLTPRKAHSR